MKLSEYIEKYGDCEVTDEIDKYIVKKPKTVYDLKYGDIYFFLTASGIVLGTIMTAIWRNDDNDHIRLHFGNVFLTEEDAKFASERLKVIAELKKYAKEFSDEEWRNKDLRKYFIGFEYKFGGFSCYIANLRRGSEIYFESIQKANEAIEAVGKDRVKKYYLGVKE